LIKDVSNFFRKIKNFSNSIVNARRGRAGALMDDRNRVKMGFKQGSVWLHRFPLAVLSSHRLPLAVQFSCFAQTSARCPQFAQTTSARYSVQLLRTDFRSLSSVHTDFRSLFSSVASHRLVLNSVWSTEHNCRVALCCVLVCAAILL